MQSEGFGTTSTVHSDFLPNTLKTENHSVSISFQCVFYSWTKYLLIKNRYDDVTRMIVLTKKTK